MRRSEYLNQLEMESRIVLEVVRAYPGLKVADLRKRLKADGHDLMYPRAAMVKLWDEGKVEVTSDRSLVASS